MKNRLKEMNQVQRDVFMLLPFGMNNLISTTEIESILKIDKRYIMGIIEELIIDFNIPIGSMRNSNNYGYFIATNKEEKYKGTVSIKQQANAMNHRVEKVQNSNVEKAIQYRELYKENYSKRDKQLDLMDYLDQSKIEAVN